MIILEGPDGAGKSMLAMRLSEELRVPVKPRVVSSDMSTEVDLFYWCRDEINRWPEAAIYDRFPLISELIYSPVFRDRPRPTFDEFSWLAKLYKEFFSIKPVVIVCLPKWEEVYANVMREETDNRVVQDKIRSIYWLYFALAAQRPEFLVWDYTQPMEYETLLQNIRTQSWRNNHLEY